MKNSPIKFLVFAFISAIGLLSACDKVDTPIEAPEVIDSTQLYPYIDTTAINDSITMVMVEEFTGHKCSFCPANTKLLLQLQDDHKDDMIVISVHAGETFAKVDEAGGYPTDFNTDYGTELHDYYKVESFGYPSALVNREAVDDNKVFASHNQWETPIVDRLNLPARLALDVAADYYEGENKINIRVSAKALENFSSEHKLIILCVEDSVVAPQKDVNSSLPNERVPDYVHRHVLRGKLNGGNQFGEVLFSGLSQGEWTESLLSTNLPSNIVTIENVTIVAFVLDSENENVVQSVEVHPHLFP